MRSVTTVRADESFGSLAKGTQDGKPLERLWLNGVEEQVGDSGRLRTCIDEMRKLRREKEAKDAKLPKVSVKRKSGFAPFEGH